MGYLVIQLYGANARAIKPAFSSNKSPISARYAGDSMLARAISPVKQYAGNLRASLKKVILLCGVICP